MSRATAKSVWGGGVADPHDRAQRFVAGDGGWGIGGVPSLRLRGAGAFAAGSLAPGRADGALPQGAPNTSLRLQRVAQCVAGANPRAALSTTSVTRPRGAHSASCVSAANARAAAMDAGYVDGRRVASAVRRGSGRQRPQSAPATHDSGRMPYLRPLTWLCGLRCSSSGASQYDVGKPGKGQGVSKPV